MNPTKKIYWYTIYALIFIFIYMLSFENYWKFWHNEKEQTPFVQDVNQYYSYLPLAIIYGDMDLEKHNHGYWGVKAPNGGVVPKMTCGMAILYSPFFLLGHKIAINQHSPLDGYSSPYATCVHYGSLFYCFLGLVILAFVLRRFFSDGAVALTLSTLFFATNLFSYTLRDGEMSHAYGFFINSVFLWLTCRWHEKRKSIYFLWIGMTIGLASLVRPAEILIVIVFIGYGVHSFSDFKNKVKEVLFSYKNIPLFLLGFILLWLPQLIFWKIKTDQLFFFSYGEEGFFWLDPQILNLLFSYRKGWFIYTPIMLFSIIGLFMLKDKSRDFKFSISAYLILNIYVLSCWWCWWYAASFGMRAVVQSYAILAVPLAAFYEKVFSFHFKKQIFTVLARSLTVFLFCGFLCLNQVQSYQYRYGIIHYEDMTEDAYWYVFGRFDFYNDADVQAFQKTLKHPDIDAAKQGKKRD